MEFIWADNNKPRQQVINKMWTVCISFMSEIYLQCLYFLFQCDNKVLRLQSSLLVTQHNQTLTMAVSYDTYVITHQ